MVMTPLIGMLGERGLAADALLPLDLRDARVGGEIGRRIDVTVNNNLVKIDIEKDFLSYIRVKKGIGGGYLGLGKLIDGAVELAAYSKNEKAIAVKKRLVDETIKAQEPDGYIGLMPPKDRMWQLWDVHEINYIIFGLVSDYHYFGEKRSLAAARKAADYLLQHWSTMPANWQGQNGIAIHDCIIGIERAMLALYRETGDRRYLDFCIHQRALPDWDLGIVIGRRYLCEAHVYSYVSRCLAQLELYRAEPDDKLLRLSRLAMDFITKKDGMMITGAVGQDECWSDDQDGRGNCGETCATAYQLRLYDSLLRLEGNPRYADLIERTIYNTLFGAESPDGRQIRYWTPFEGPRSYWGDRYVLLSGQLPADHRRIADDGLLPLGARIDRESLHAVRDNRGTGPTECR